MRLVIERDGGFDIIPDSDDIKRIEPANDGVRVTFTDDTDEFFAVESHAAACQLAAAIAVKCGVLVEPLAEQPAEWVDPAFLPKQEPVKAGAAAAEVSEWLDGEPPRDGQFHECEFIRLGGVRPETGQVRWRDRWARGCGGGVRRIVKWKRVSPYMPAAAAATESQWVAGEPPKDGRWYVAVIGFVPASLKCPKAVRWSKAQWLDSDGVGWGDTLPLAHLLPPIPDVPVQLTQTGAGGTQ